MPKVLNKYRAQYLPDDWDQLILTNDAQRLYINEFVKIQYHLDATNLALEYAEEQGIANL